MLTMTHKTQRKENIRPKNKKNPIMTLWQEDKEKNYKTNKKIACNDTMIEKTLEKIELDYPKKIVYNDIVTHKTQKN